MAIQLTDLVMISRGGTLYSGTGEDFVNLVTDNIGANQYTVADMVERDALSDQSIGDRVFVTDASGDPEVASGWAIFRWMGTAWVKVAEEESMDLLIQETNLGTYNTPTHITITNTGGTNTTLVSANAINAGLLVPADFVKLQNISVTSAVDLDALNNESHPLATTAGTTATNPINIDSSQLVSFSIDQLAPLP